MGEKSTPSSPRKRMNSSSHVKTESKPAANGFAPVIFAPVRRDLEGLAPMEQRKCPIQDCDSSGKYNFREISCTISQKFRVISRNFCEIQK